MTEYYFDFAATTNVSEEVYEVMKPYFTSLYGNPSSLHQKGIVNRKTINTCKKEIASLLEVSYKELVFTSCGTESINTAIKGVAYASNKNEIITTKIEHHATLHTTKYLEQQGYIVHYLDVDSEGFIDLNQLESLLNNNTVLVSIILANNEIGTIQNYKEIKKLLDSTDVYLHYDAVQALCHYDFNINELGADLVSFSAHKIHGPKGIGLLYIKEGTKIDNLIHGGAQEFGKRSGTENIAYIKGFTEAIKIGLDHKELSMYQKTLYEYQALIIKELTKLNIDFLVNGPKNYSNKLPGVLSLSFKGISNHDLAFALNKKGIYLSTGSACDSTNILPSHVITATCNDTEYINGVIRISFSKDTTLKQVTYLINELKNSIG